MTSPIKGNLFSILTFFFLLSNPLSLIAQTFTGRTEAYEYATISATVPGRVSKIINNAGAVLKKGQTILYLEKDEEELEVARRKLIFESKVEVNSARFQVDILKKDYEATKQLFDSLGSVSEDELWKKELEYKQAVGEFERLTMLEQREEIEYKMAEAQLARRYINAPFSGEVVTVMLREGESCDAQEPLVKLVNVEKCRFIAHIDVTASQKFKKGTKVNLSIKGASAPIQLTGSVEFIAPVVDPSSGLLEVRIVFENSDRLVRPGVLGTMSFSTESAGTQ